jgi:hypothetical protein
VPGGNDLEDERGVDRAQIRELLDLTPAERVDRLIAVAVAWDDILTTARATPTGR